MFISYFQEYRSLQLQLSPNVTLDSTKREHLNLSANAPLYSGLFFQYKGTSIYLAGVLPQDAESKAKYGEQSSNIWRAGFQFKGLTLNFNHLKYQGMYDQNFYTHADTLSDINAYSRYNNLRTLWLNFDIKYYPQYNRFALGMPYSYLFQQIKSRFALGYKLSYNYIKTDNQDKALFNTSLQNANAAYSLRRLDYNGVNAAVLPSYYGVLSKHWFLYLDLGLGLDFNFTTQQYLDLDKSTLFKVAFTVPEVHSMLGFQNDNWVLSVYYNYINQNFKAQYYQAALFHHTFGIIAGYRFYAPARLAF